MAAFFIIFTIMMMVGMALVVFDIDMHWELPERPKVRKLKAEIRDLRATIKLLDEKNIELTTEVLAHRNRLPWVDIKELDGSQE